MAAKPLTVKGIEAANPKETRYRLADGGGLFLAVHPTGRKVWEFRYKLAGKAQTLTIGPLGTYGLAEARQKAGEARKLAAEGQHLTASKNVAKARKTAAAGALFAAAADDWVADEAKRKKWTADYKGEVEASLRNHLSKLNTLPVDQITAAICSPILRASEKRSPDMARKVRTRLRGILDFAVEHGLIAGNPLPATRGGAKVERQHLPAELSRDGVAAILRAAEKTDVGRGVKRAHLLCVFTAQRIGEIVAAEWSEFDLDVGVWSIPRERMKRKDKERGPHRVPLAPVLLSMLQEWKRADGEDAVYVCPSARGEGPITREAVEKFYRNTLRLAGKHGAHGWRSVFSTWAYEAKKDGDAIEAQLDHVIGSKVQRAYDRDDRLERRRPLMVWHEATLIAARDGAEVVVLSDRRA